MSFFRRLVSDHVASDDESDEEKEVKDKEDEPLEQLCVTHKLVNVLNSTLVPFSSAQVTTQPLKAALKTLAFGDIPIPPENYKRGANADDDNNSRRLNMYRTDL